MTLHEEPLELSYMRHQTPYSPWKGKALFPFHVSHCPCTWSCHALWWFWCSPDPQKELTIQLNAMHITTQQKPACLSFTELRNHCREGQTNVTKECGRGTCSGQDTPASVEERDEAHLAQLDLTFCNSVISELTMVPTGRCRCSHEWNTLISYTRHFYIVLKSPVTLTVSMLSLIW